MDQPIGFVSKGGEDKVCHLKRSIYGLMQSSRLWYVRFHETINLFNLSIVSENHLCMSRKQLEGLCFLPGKSMAYFRLGTTWR